MRTASDRERVLLVGLARSTSEVSVAEASLDELAALADTAGAETVDRVIQVREAPDPATYIGKGKAKDVVQRARLLDAAAIVFDDELAPAQGRNLEDVAAVNPLAPDALRIIDRTQLILDVFAQHARSAEGKLQVELAQINYLVPRLRGWGEVLSRIGGGAGSRGGAAIGTRGPGETQLEVDRRKIQRRLKKLRRDLKELERTRRVSRRLRERRGVLQVSLVGYTNAGKSTLLNALTGAGVMVEDRLFSTLDPTARRLELPGGKETVLIDTVGFVRKLPHQLVEAFGSTLEESIGADLLLHVIDASHPEPDEQAAAVNQVLAEIGGGTIPVLLVLNKRDLLDAESEERVMKLFPEGTLVSARSGGGLDDLREAVALRLDSAWTVAVFMVPFNRGDVRSALHRDGDVLEESHTQAATRLVVRLDAAGITRFGGFISREESRH